MLKENIFGERLRGIRRKAGLTQKKAAAKFGISEIGYQHYEAGRRNPSFAMVSRLAKFYNVSLDYLFGFTDEPHLPSKETWAIIHAIEAQQAKQQAEA